MLSVELHYHGLLDLVRKSPEHLFNLGPLSIEIDFVCVEVIKKDDQSHFLRRQRFFLFDELFFKFFFYGLLPGAYDIEIINFDFFPVLVYLEIILGETIDKIPLFIRDKNLHDNQFDKDFMLQRLLCFLLFLESVE